MGLLKKVPSQSVKCVGRPRLAHGISTCPRASTTPAARAAKSLAKCCQGQGWPPITHVDAGFLPHTAIGASRQDRSSYDLEDRPEMLMTEAEFEQSKVLKDLAHTVAGRDLNMNHLVQGTKMLQVAFPPFHSLPPPPPPPSLASTHTSSFALSFLLHSPWQDHHMLKAQEAHNLRSCAQLVFIPSEFIPGLPA